MQSPHLDDVSNCTEVHSAQSWQELGQVTKVIHAAGISGSMADAEKIIRINALGTVYVNQEFYKVMDWWRNRRRCCFELWLRCQADDSLAARTPRPH